MKKFILTGIGVALVAIGVQAQTFRAQSFLAQGVKSVYVTNTLSITNLNTSGAPLTNNVGTAWSNYVSGGTSLFISGGTGSTYTNTTKNLLKDVDLWVRKDGTPAFTVGATNASVPASFGDAVVAVRIASGGSGANAAVTFVFTPLYGIGVDSASAGLNPKPVAVEGPAADQWSFSVTSAGTASVVLVTNAPMYKWPGARGLRLRRIVNEDTDASSQVIINEVSLNGYVP